MERQIINVNDVVKIYFDNTEQYGRNTNVSMFPIFKNYSMVFDRDSLNGTNFGIWMKEVHINMIQIDMDYYPVNDNVIADTQKSVDKFISFSEVKINDICKFDNTVDTMPFLADDMLNQLVRMCKTQRIFVHGDIYKAKYLVKTNFNFYTDKHKWNSFGGIQFFVNNNGKRMEGYYNFTDPDIAKVCRKENLRKDCETIGALYDFLNHLTYFIVSILNCKNVSVDITKKGHKFNKKKGSKVTHNIVHIKPMQARKNYIGKTNHTGDKRAYHIRRGHFADYTKGKGLFGKLKGVFWFDDIIVGNIKNGQVNKSYIVDMKE